MDHEHDFSEFGGGENMLDELRQIGKNLESRKKSIETSTGARRYSGLASSRAPDDDDDSADSDSDFESAEPSLGPDIFDLRAKTVMLTASASATSDATARPLASGVQIDLNNAEALQEAGLDDPNLRAHMDRARAQWFESQKRTPADLKTLKAKDAAVRRALSTVLTELVAQKRSLQNIEEEVRLQAEKACAIIAGGTPHGYSADMTPEAKGRILLKKAKSVAEECATVNASLTEFEKTLTLARRDYETVVDELMPNSTPPN